MTIAKTISLSDFNHDLDSEIRGMLEKSGTPGAAVSVALPDLNIASTYGFTDTIGSRPVGPETVFDIGSCSKSFVATAVALLVSEGKLSFDDPAHKYLPELRLDTPELTQEVTVRDLLCNRTGLKRQVPVESFANPEIRIPEILGRLQYLERAVPFRGGYVYFNPGFMASTLIVERISGMPYDRFLEEALFAPLDMQHTASGVRPFEILHDRGPGHTSTKGTMVPIDVPNYDNWQGAAGIYINVGDGLKWLRLHLSGGKAGDRQLIRQEVLQEIHNAHTPMPDAECKLIHKPPEAKDCDYCMGWWRTSLHGETLIQHAGATMGWRAQMSMNPGRQIATSVFLNAAAEIYPAITYLIMETLMTGKSRDWEAISARQRDEQAANTQGYFAHRFACENEKPLSLPIEAYTGLYEHPACGCAEFVANDDGTLEYCLLDGSLWDASVTHLGEDTFECHFINPAARDFIPGGWRLQFQVTDGVVTALEDHNARFTKIP